MTMVGTATNFSWCGPLRPALHATLKGSRYADRKSAHLKRVELVAELTQAIE